MYNNHNIYVFLDAGKVEVLVIIKFSLPTIANMTPSLIFYSSNLFCNIFPCAIQVMIKTHSSVLAAKKAKKTYGTQVCYLLVL